MSNCSCQKSHVAWIEALLLTGVFSCIKLNRASAFFGTVKGEITPLFFLFKHVIEYGRLKHI